MLPEALDWGPPVRLPFSFESMHTVCAMTGLWPLEWSQGGWREMALGNASARRQYGKQDSAAGASSHLPWGWFREWRRALPPLYLPRLLGLAAYGPGSD